MIKECLNDLKPIELNEEIILKYGFHYIEHEKGEVNEYEENTSVFCIGEDDFIKLKFVSEWYGSTKSNSNKYIQFYFYGNSIRTIKYLHQLKKLYFALTDKELLYNEG